MTDKQTTQYCPKSQKYARIIATTKNDVKTRWDGRYGGPTQDD